LGIIAFLSFTFFIYEVQMYSEPDIAEVIHTIPTDYSVDVTMGEVIAIPNVVPERKPIIKPRKTKTITEEIPNEVDNNITEAKIVKKIPEEPIKKQPEKTDGKKIKVTTQNTSVKNEGKTENKINTVYTSKTVDFLPIFPGCNKFSTNDERALCFQKKIQRLVSKNSTVVWEKN